ncbi:MAG TPA: MFS transporter [Solirubrobacteraceae bacterium]|nr:MFS transporter [Solirubrobacteraceae bacterium]
MKRSTVTLALLCSAQFLIVLDVTIVAIALPDIRDDLGFSSSSLQWVLSAYTLTFGGLLVAAGRLGDLLCRRRLFVAGLAAFGAASLACALAPTAGALVAGRAVQGVAAALLTPAALALLTAEFPEPAARRHAVGWWTAAAAGGGASGWVLGGVLVQALGWTAVFLVNVPLCAAGAVVAARVLGRDDARREGSLRGLDVPGAVAVTVGLALLMLALTRLESAGPDPLALAGLAGAAAALALFARIERHAAAPILPGWTLRRPAFTTAAGAAAVLTAATTPAMFLAILYQQETLGRQALEAGLWCLPFNLAVIAGSLLGPRARWSPRAAMAGGLVAIAAGAAALMVREPAALPPAFVLMGAGLGVAAVASTASGTAALEAHDQGIASGVLNAAAQVGTALGLGLVVTLAAATSARAGLAAAAVFALVAAVAVTNPGRASTEPA